MAQSSEPRSTYVPPGYASSELRYVSYPWGGVRGSARTPKRRASQTGVAQTGRVYPLNCRRHLFASFDAATSEPMEETFFPA